MKQGRKCKDALINYRNACQQVNVASLEDVIKYLLQVASARAEEASKAAEAKLEGVEDLEAEASPEEMMLSYVSGEKSKDRTDRELVTPWFKFLWESYRCVWGGGGGGGAHVGIGGRRGGCPVDGVAGMSHGGASGGCGGPRRVPHLAASPGGCLCAGMCSTSCATTRGWRGSTPWPRPVPSRCGCCCCGQLRAAAGSCGQLRAAAGSSGGAPLPTNPVCCTCCCPPSPLTLPAPACLAWNAATTAVLPDLQAHHRVPPALRHHPQPPGQPAQVPRPGRPRPH